MKDTIEKLLQQKYELLTNYRITKVEAVKFDENSSRGKELAAQLECIEKEISAIDHDIEQLQQTVKSDVNAEANPIIDPLPQQAPQFTNEPNQPATASPKKGLHGFIIFLIVAIVISAFIFGVVKVIDCANNPNNSDGNLKLLSRSARYSDVTITRSDDFTLTYKFNLVPNVDIENLEITMNFLDSSLNTVKTKTKTIGNVAKNGTYSFSFSLTEFTITENNKIEKWQYEVTGGTVKYFA